MLESHVFLSHWITKIVLRKQWPLEYMKANIPLEPVLMLCERQCFECINPLLRSVGQFSYVCLTVPPPLLVASWPNYKTLLLLSKVVHPTLDTAPRLSIRKVVLILPSVTLLVFQPARYSVDITIAVEKIGHSLVFHNLSAFNYETFDSPFANCLLISIFQVC